MSDITYMLKVLHYVYLYYILILGGVRVYFERPVHCAGLFVFKLLLG